MDKSLFIFFLSFISYLIIPAIFSLFGFYWVNDLFNLIIFIAIIGFIFSLGKIDKKRRGIVIELIIVYAVLNGMVSLILDKMHVYKAKHSPIERACFNNIRVITAAVENYNMDVSVADMMKELNIDKLINKGYLKAITLPKSTCKYENTTDLTEYGLVYCVTHGSPVFNSINYDDYSKMNAYKIPKKFRNTINYKNIIKDFFQSKDYLYIIRLLFFPYTFNQLR